MELLGYTHAAMAHEDPLPSPELRSPEELAQITETTIKTVIGGSAALSILAIANPSQAVVKSPDRCPAVGDVQRALNAAGFSAGSVDNVFGSQTETAVKQFQRFKGLSADGIVGPSTADALGLGDAENPNSPYLIGNSCGTGGGGGGVSMGSATVTAGSGLVVRAAAATGSDSLGSLAPGAVVSYDGIATGQSINGDTRWLFLPSYGGYIAAYYTNVGTGGGGGSSGNTVRITAGSGLVVRSGASQLSGSVGFVGSGATVGYSQVVTGASVNGDTRWLYVPSQSGYISAYYTTLGTGGGGGSSGNTATVTASGGLIVRAAPATGSNNLGSVGSGASITYSSISTGQSINGDTRWLYLPAYGGYVAAYYTNIGTGGGGGSSGDPNLDSATILAPGGLIVRSNPSQSSSNIGFLGYRESIGYDGVVTGTSVNGDTRWLYIPEYRGYIAAYYTNIGTGGGGGSSGGGTTDPNLEVVQEVGYSPARIATVATFAGPQPVKREPNRVSTTLTTVPKGTYVAYDKRARLANNQEWFYLPAYNGWVEGNALDFVD